MKNFKTIENLVKSYGYTLGEQLGCGLYGCAYSVIMLDNSMLDVVKFTTDTNENTCVQKIIEKKGWEKTKHLPEIYAFGGPITIDEKLLQGFDSDGFKPTLYFYFREELVDVPLEFLPTDEERVIAEKAAVTEFDYAISSYDKGIRHAILDIAEKTGLCMMDAHHKNWGFRVAELEAFSVGKTTKIPTYVMRDLACTECKIANWQEKYSRLNAYD